MFCVKGLTQLHTSLQSVAILGQLVVAAVDRFLDHCVNRQIGPKGTDIRPFSTNEHALLILMSTYVSNVTPKSGRANPLHRIGERVSSCAVKSVCLRQSGVFFIYLLWIFKNGEGNVKSKPSYSKRCRRSIVKNI